MINAFIGIGSNLQDPLRQITLACTSLTRLPMTAFCRASSCYRSPPLGPADQPDFINQVVLLNTALPPEQLLDYLQAIERQQGRVRLAHWGPRIIDLDILLYGEQVIATERLTVPHSGLKGRAFFLRPLAELAPDLILPTGESILALSRQFLPHAAEVI